MKHWKVVLPLLTVFGGLLLFTIHGCESGPPDAATVRKHMTSDQLELGDPVVNSVGMVLVPIPAGEFQMGTPLPKSKKPGQFKSEIPQHPVKITEPFYMGVCEVTQQQYEQVMGERPWEGKPLVEEGPNYAATYISWKNAVDFCEKLSELESKTYRLPTEAEWEYACRAGTKTAFSFGKNGKRLGEYAWFDKNAYKDGEQYAHLVGQKKPNPWALYDMHGNAWEWCQDKYGKYNGRKKAAVDPKGPKKGRVRVWRGGGFSDNPINLRSATRLSFSRVGYSPKFAVGFRVVRNFNADR